MPPLRMRGCGELFQFPQRNRGRLPVRLNDAAVVHRDGEDRHGLGRGALEVEKDTGGGASTHHSPRSQSLTGHRMEVVAQPQERFPCDDLTLFHAQPFDRDADPLAGLLVAHRQVLRIIIVVGKVLVEVGRGGPSVLLWLSRKHGQESSPEPGAFCVTATQNARGIRAILVTMKRTFMRPESGTQLGAFCAGIVQKDGAGGTIVRSMNGWPFMRRNLPQKPESEGAQCAPSSPVPGLRREAMKGHLMRWKLPEKPGPHCEPQSQSLARPWVKKGPMKTRLMRSAVARPTAQNVRRCRLDERAGHGRKKQEVGMTPTPPQAGEETARCRARKLIDPMAQRESCAVWRHAVALLDTERPPDGRKGEMKVR